MIRKILIFLSVCSLALAGGAIQSVPYYGPFSYQTIQQMVSAQTGCSTAGNVWSPAGNSCIAPGNAPVAQLVLPGQSANISLTTLYTVPTGKSGWYLINYTAVITQAATTSSTLPKGLVQWIDKDTGVSVNGAIGTTSPTNIVGLNSSELSAPPNDMMLVKDGTAITVGTLSYASSGATPMVFTAHYSLYYLGTG
jgi:hypothetical protein